MPTGELPDALRARGLRMTPQRQRVLDAVRALGHATPEEISASLSDVDVATVYRAVQLLESLGLVAHTHLGHGAPSYRPAEDEHIHIVCHDCGGVVDAPAGLVGPLVRRLRDERGFTVDLAHFTVFGRCADCSASPAPTPAATVHHHHHLAEPQDGDPLPEPTPEQADPGTIRGRSAMTT
jgi:Fur family ferric uptake transcriptional regulator